MGLQGHLLFSCLVLFFVSTVLGRWGGRGLVSNSLWLLTTTSSNPDSPSTQLETNKTSKTDKEVKASAKDDQRQFIIRRYLKETELSSASTDVLEQLKEADTVEEALHIMEDIPAIQRSVDRAMRITTSSSEDALLAVRILYKIAYLLPEGFEDSPVHSLGLRKDRRVQQLVECADPHLKKLSTIELARYLWAYTKLSIDMGDVNSLKNVLKEYDVRVSDI
eukprot:gene32916-39806_t